MTKSNERGSALIITLMLLVILTAIGIYAISISTTEMNIALQSRVGASTLNAADSGVNAGIDNVPSIFSVSQVGSLLDGSGYSWTSRATGTLTIRPGYGANFRFADFEVTSQGTAPPQFTGTRGVQAVAIYGPVPMGTMY
jgi:hypothetical protein